MTRPLLPMLGINVEKLVLLDIGTHDEVYR